MNTREWSWEYKTWLDKMIKKEEKKEWTMENEGKIKAWIELYRKCAEDDNHNYQSIEEQYNNAMTSNAWARNNEEKEIYKSEKKYYNGYIKATEKAANKLRRLKTKHGET